MADKVIILVSVSDKEKMIHTLLRPIFMLASFTANYVIFM